MTLEHPCFKVGHSPIAQHPKAGWLRLVFIALTLFAGLLSTSTPSMAMGVGVNLAFYKINGTIATFDGNYNQSAMTSYLNEMQAHHLTYVRTWVCTEFVGLSFDGSGNCTGVSSQVIGNMQNFAGLANARGIKCEFVFLTSGDLQSRPGIVNNAANRTALINNGLIPFGKALESYDAQIDLCNEGNYAVGSIGGWGNFRTWMSACKSALVAAGVDRWVTMSDASYPDMVNNFSGTFGGLGLDYYEYHMYNDQGWCPVPGNLGDGKPVELNEFGSGSLPEGWNHNTYSFNSALLTNFVNDAHAAGYYNIAPWCYIDDGDFQMRGNPVMGDLALWGQIYNGAPGEAPYGGIAATVPGTVQAENYDTGGQNVGYWAPALNGTANGYRPDGVDMETCADTGGGYNIGWTTTGQWMHYTVNVQAAGTYTVTFRVAAPAAVTDAFHLSSAGGTNLSGNVNVSATGGWQTWMNVTTTVTLPAGTQVLTVNQNNPGWNINAITFAQNAPPAPSGLTATPGNAQVALAWSTVADASSYNIYRATAVGAEGTNPLATSSTANYTDNGVGNGMAYYYTVAAVNLGGASAQSGEVSATPLPPAPSAPTSLTATTGNTKVTLAWTASAGATGYNVYRGTAAGAEGATAIASTSSLRYVNTGLLNGTTYYYQVKAVNLGGTSAASSEAHAVSFPVGTHTLTPKCATATRLDDTGGSTANGNHVQIWTATGGPNQAWTITNVGGNNYTLSVNGAHCLDSAGATSPGTQATIWSCLSNTNQTWTATPQNGGYSFKAANSGLCLDVRASGTANGTVVQTYTCNSGLAQTWTIN